jgi:hypothetical protein
VSVKYGDVGYSLVEVKTILNDLEKLQGKIPDSTAGDVAGGLVTKPSREAAEALANIQNESGSKGDAPATSASTKVSLSEEGSDPNTLSI